MMELDGRGGWYGGGREKERLWVFFMVLLVAVAVAPASMAGTCTYALQATKTVFGPEGGSGTMTVDTQEGCTWNAVAWDLAQITGPASGTGSGAVDFTVPRSEEWWDASSSIGVFFQDGVASLKIKQIGVEGSSIVVPVAAELPGERGTSWRTELCVFNPNGGAAASARLRLYFLPESQQPADQVELTPDDVVVPPLGTLCQRDVLSDLDHVKGALRVQVDNVPELPELPIVTSRTYTPAAGGGVGTYGQNVPAVSMGRSSEVAELTITGLEHYQNPDGSGFRTSIGLVNLHYAAVGGIVIHLIDSDGHDLGSYETGLWFRGFAQIDRIVEKILGPGAELKDFSVIIRFRRADFHGGEEGAWRNVAAYASMVDDSTGDAVFLPARPVECGWGTNIVVPVVANLPGEGQTYWRSSLCVFNRSSTEEEAFHLKFYPASSRPVQPIELLPEDLVLAPHASHCWADILAAEPHSKGALRAALEPSESGCLWASSRTYTADPSSAGTYGQTVAVQGFPFLATHGLAIGGLHHYRNADGSGFRTAIGLVNGVHLDIGGIVIHIYDAQGNEAGSFETGLYGNGFLQLDRIVELALGPGAELQDFSVIIRFKDAAGIEGAARKVRAYASVIDEATGDATFISAAPLD